MPSTSLLKRALLLLLPLVALLLSGCECGCQPAPPPGPVGTIEKVTCATDVETATLSHTVSCGYLSVPEDHNNPSGQRIQLAYAMLHNDSGTPSSDPLLYLSGGPGGRATDWSSHFDLTPYLQQRDIILLDQRGTGLSEPLLNCDRYTDYSSCRDGLSAAGSDLNHYNTTQSAHDVELLRLALGAQQWNLLGVSYGTRLAEEVMRLYPDSLRSVVLDSSILPGQPFLSDAWHRKVQSFESLFARCSADPLCASDYPNLRQRFLTLVDQLNQQPIYTVLPNNGTQQERIDGELFAGILFNLSYVDWLLPGIPYLIHHVEQGSLTDFAWLTSALLQSRSGFADGMYRSVLCHDLAPLDSEQSLRAAFAATPEFAGLDDIDASVANLLSCSAWSSQRADSGFYSAPNSSVPTLILAGEHDPITPPSNGIALHGMLANSFYLEFTSYSHGVSSNPCGETVTHAFLNDPQQNPDQSCRNSLQNAPFTGPQDLLIRSRALTRPRWPMLTPWPQRMIP